MVSTWGHAAPDAASSIDILSIGPLMERNFASETHENEWTDTNINQSLWMIGVKEFLRSQAGYPPPPLGQ
jgi:hypothetical protein